MTRRFMLMVDDATPPEQDAVTKYLQTLSYGFWHYFSDGWLIVDRSSTLTAPMLRDKLKQLVPGKTTLVVPMNNPAEWAGFGTTENFQWLHDVWNAP